MNIPEDTLRQIAAESPTMQGFLVGFFLKQARSASSLAALESRAGFAREAKTHKIACIKRVRESAPDDIDFYAWAREIGVPLENGAGNKPSLVSAKNFVDLVSGR
jgi:hypothetical protein